MRYITWALVGLVAVSALAVGGAFVFLQTADLAKLAVSMVKSQTGLDVQAESLTLKMWPQPEVHATKLVVPSAHGGPSLLTVDKADVVLAWGSFPFFWKGITPQDVTLDNPTVYLNKPADGPANWQLELPAAEAPTHDAGTTLTRTDRLPINTFGKITVTNLNLAYFDEASGRKVDVKGVTLQADGTKLDDAHITLVGAINGHTLNGKTSLSLTDLARVPLTATLQAGDIKLALDGEVRDQQAYAGAINVQTPNLKDALTKLMGTAPAQAPSNPFALTGDIDAGGEILKLNNFNANLGDFLKATGDVDITLGATPSAKGEFRISGTNLRALLALATGKNNPSIPATPFKLATYLTGKDAITLQNLNAQLDGIVSLSGNATLVPATSAGGMPKVDATLTARGGSLQALARAFGSSAQVPAQAFSAGATIRGQNTYTLSDLSAQLGTLATLSGNLTVTPQPALKLAGDIALQGNDLATTAAAFGAKGNLPRSPFNAGFTLGGTDRIELSNLNISLPQLLEAKGSLSLAPAAPHDIKGQLAVSRLNLNALGYCATPAASSAATADTATRAAPAAGAPWTDKPLPLDALRGTTFNITLDVAGLSCTSFPAKTLALKAVNTASTLTLSDVAVAMADGGGITSNLTLAHAATPALDIALTTTDLRIETLVKTLADKGVELPLSGNVKLTSAGATTRALANNVDGTIRFTANDGRLPYQQMLGNITQIASLLQGKMPTQTSDAIQKVVADYTVTNGIMSTKELSIVTGGMTLAGTGTINLPAWTIDYQLKPEIDVGDKIGIPVNIKGALGAPSIGPDTDFISKLTGRLATEGVKGLLGVGKEGAKGIGGAVGEILGGQGLQGDNVQKGLQNLLKNVVKTPTPPAAEPTPAPAAETPPPAPEAPPAETPPPADPVGDILNNVLQGQ